MDKKSPLAEDGEPVMKLDTGQTEEVVHIDPFNPNTPQLLLWEAIKIVPVPEGPIISEK